ncbi:MAG: MarR family transcriptional regulator [Salinibacterium sp.]|nr:MarR family transcriptional regulator [Salinibacterium sp.]MBF0672367.1 MarR family transcriptional regulator [Salinibacterium sp.]
MAAASEITNSEWMAWRGLQVMQRQLHAALEERLQADAAISSPDFEVLSTLASAERNAVRSGDLAVLMGWEKSRLSHQVRRMESRGLIRRRECETDLRGTWIELTDAGRDAVSAALPDHRAALRSLFFDLLSDDEKAALAGVADKVIGAMEPGACDLAERVMGSPEPNAAR